MSHPPPKKKTTLTYSVVQTQLKEFGINSKCVVNKNDDHTVKTFSKLIAWYSDEYILLHYEKKLSKMYNSYY